MQHKRRATTGSRAKDSLHSHIIFGLGIGRGDIDGMNERLKRSLIAEGSLGSGDEDRGGI